MTERMMRKNYHRQPGRVDGHGEDCADCKPDEWFGRAAENRAWKCEAEREAS